LVSLPPGTDPAGLIANGRTGVLDAALTSPTPDNCFLMSIEFQRRIDPVVLA
jgi:hypothetical protein